LSRIDRDFFCSFLLFLPEILDEATSFLAGNLPLALIEEGGTTTGAVAVGLACLLRADGFLDEEMDFFALFLAGGEAV
jgi:hypothetical protein